MSTTGPAVQCPAALLATVETIATFGSRTPSVRELADALGISRAALVVRLDRLVEAGKLTAKRRREIIAAEGR